MARPTMSRVLYTQQLGRGMRLYPGKESLMVFDFVDNASQYNMPQSLHRLFKLKEYRPGEKVVAPPRKRLPKPPCTPKGRNPKPSSTGRWMPPIMSWWTSSTGRTRRKG